MVTLAKGMCVLVWACSWGFCPSSGFFPAEDTQVQTSAHLAHWSASVSRVLSHCVTILEVREEGWCVGWWMQWDFSEKIPSRFTVELLEINYLWLRFCARESKAEVLQVEAIKGCKLKLGSPCPWEVQQQHSEVAQVTPSTHMAVVT